MRGQRGLESLPEHLHLPAVDLRLLRPSQERHRGQAPGHRHRSREPQVDSQLFGLGRTGEPVQRDGAWRRRCAPGTPWPVSTGGSSAVGLCGDRSCD